MMNGIRSMGFVVLWALLVQVACSSTSPATVTRRAHIPLDPEKGIFVVAHEQRDTIIASLEKAQIRIATDLESMGYALDVRLGSPRGSRECGSVHNVVYTLSDRGQKLLVIKGRGPTGDCDPNIFDDMSEELAINLY